MDLSVSSGEGVMLHVRHRPGTGGPAFLLVHGLASNARLWDEVAGRLAGAGHPVYAVDLRGHGRSDSPDGGYDTATAATDLAAVAAELGLAEVVIAGHSWGGDVAVHLAAARPSLVAGLVLLDGGYTDAAAVYGVWDDFVGTLALSQPDLGGATLDDIRDYLRTIHPDWSTTAVEASLFSLRTNPDGTLSPLPSLEQRTSIMRSLWEDPTPRLHPEVTAPVLLMPAIPRDNERWSRKVRLLFERIRQAARTAAATLPDATVRVYRDTVHEMHAQYPGRVADDLLAFTAAIQGRPPS
jgi:pimeloyl-ACP methyl ester carboxylesterase